jgi:YfiH family protein
MADRADHTLRNGAVVHTLFSDVYDGDLAVTLPPEVLEPRRSLLAAGSWTWLKQVHGAEVVRVAAPGEGAGTTADASMSTVGGAVLAVAVADCTPLLMWAPLGTGAVVAAVHAGWRGILTGVIGSAVRAMAAEGVEPAELGWAIGACICPEHYEFDGPQREELAEMYGPPVAALTATGSPSLDLRAAVAGAMAAEGVSSAAHDAASVCTLESDRHWSHRGDGSRSRQVGAIWWRSGPS